eukprot:gene19068-25672_t
MSEAHSIEGSEESCVKALAEMSLTQEDQSTVSSPQPGQVNESFSTSIESGAECSSSGGFSQEHNMENLDSYLQSHGVSQPLGSLVASGAVLEGQPGGPVQGITVQGGKPHICFDFTKGLCTRGDKCKYSHDLATIVHFNSKEKGICFDYLRNQCHRGLMCRFSHDLTNIAQQCQMPTSNPALAGMAGRGRTNAICYDFVKGVCQRGGVCRYSHDLSLIARTARGGANYTRSGEVCYDFLRGRCNRGQSCKYSHNTTFLNNSQQLGQGSLDAQMGGLGQACMNGGMGGMMGGGNNSADMSMLLALMAQRFGSLPGDNRGLGGGDMSDEQAAMFNNPALMNLLQQRQLAAAAAGMLPPGYSVQQQMQQQAAAAANAVMAAQYNAASAHGMGGRSGSLPTPDQLAHNVAAAVVANNQQQQQHQQAAAMALSAVLMQQRAVQAQAQQNHMAGCGAGGGAPTGGHQADGGQMYPPSSAAMAAAQHLLKGNSAPANMPFLKSSNSGAPAGMSPDQLNAMLSNVRDNPALLSETLKGLAAAAQAQVNAQAHAQAQHAASFMMHQKQQQGMPSQGTSNPQGMNFSQGMNHGMSGAMGKAPSAPQPIPGRYDAGSPPGSFPECPAGMGAPLRSMGSSGSFRAQDYSDLSRTAPTGINDLQTSLSPDLMPLLKEIWNKAS